jgi:cell division protein FtsB
VPERPRLPILPIVICAAIVIAGFLALSITRHAIRNYQLHEEERVLQHELLQLDRDHDQLSVVRDYLQSDEYIEDVARRTLGLVKPGETLVIVSGTDAPPPTSATPTPADGRRTWWRDLFVAPETVPTATPPAPQAD